MTKREVAKLACRVLSVYILVFALIDVPRLVGFLDWSTAEPEQKTMLALAAASTWGMFLLRLLFGVALWALSDRIAARIAPDVGTTAPEKPQITSNDYLKIALSAIGAFLLVSGLSRIIGYVTAGILAARSQQATFGEVSGSITFSSGDIWTNVAQSVLGLALLLGSSSLVQILRRPSAPKESTTVESDGV